MCKVARWESGGLCMYREGGGVSTVSMEDCYLHRHNELGPNEVPMLRQGRAEVYYIESAENVADIPTKNIPLQLVTQFSGRMGLVSVTV